MISSLKFQFERGRQYLQECDDFIRATGKGKSTTVKAKSGKCYNVCVVIDKFV